MLITVTEEGPVSRPMKMQEVEFAENPLFPSKSDTAKLFAAASRSESYSSHAIELEDFRDVLPTRTFRAGGLLVGLYDLLRVKLPPLTSAW